MRKTTEITRETSLTPPPLRGLNNSQILQEKRSDSVITESKKAKKLNSPKFFKPLIASSLALALGASMAVANPTIESGLEGSEGKVDLSGKGLTWDSTTASGFYIPKANSQIIENLNFTFDTTTSGVDGSPTGTTYNTTINATTNPSFKITSTQGLQMGANGNGTLQVHFVKHESIPLEVFQLDLSQVKGTALKGNLTINAAQQGSRQKFVGIFGGNLDGNLLVDANAFSHNGGGVWKNVFVDLTFNNNSTITGDITIKGSRTTLTFNDEGKTILQGLDFQWDGNDRSQTLTIIGQGELQFEKKLKVEKQNILDIFARNISFKNSIEGGGTINLSGSSVVTLEAPSTPFPKGQNRYINGLNFKDRSRLNLNAEQAVWSQKMAIVGNNTIDLRNPDQGKYNLLEIGDKNPAPNSTNGLSDSLVTQATFIFKVGSEGQLGGSYGQKHGYGYSASDRLVLHSIGNNSAKAKGHYRLVLDGENLSSYTYQGETTGTETKGNVAIATIAKISGNPSPQGSTQQEKIKSLGLISFDGAYALNSGFEVFSYNLMASVTNDKGSADGNGGYITYFLDGGKNNGLYGGLKTSLSSVAFANTDLYLANLNSLNKRMGELRNNAHSQGAWGRIFVGKLSDDVGLGSETSFLTLQAGYDYAFGFEGANNYLGFALSYSNGSSKGMRGYSDGTSSLSLSSMTSHLIEFGIYNSYVSDSGWYNDSIAKFGFGMNDSKIKANLGSQMDIDTSLDSFTFALSNEMGYRVKFGGEKEFYIDPQFELGMGLISGGEMQVDGSGGQNLNATSENLFVIRSRLGASLGYDFKRWMKESEVGAILYLGGFVEDDRFFGGGYSYNDGQKVDNAIDSDTRFILNVGSNVAIKDNMRIYVDFEKGFGGKITTDYKVNAGLRYSFGENANYKNISSNERESKDTKAPIKLEEKNEKKK